MKVAISRLWNEEVGAIVSAEIMLIASILVIGAITGLAALRDSVVTELGDVAQALANVNQSYSYGGAAGHHSFVGGGSFLDLADFCDTADADNSATAQNSKCIVVCNTGVIPGSTEGT